MKLVVATLIAAELSLVGRAQAQPAEPASVEAPAPAALEPAETLLSTLQIHGFASEGGFASTANDYIGHSSRGSLELFEAGINFSTQLSDRLRVGVQLFSQDEGTTNDATPRLDWAYLDYRVRSWLGLRAGRVKIPFGLYNDYIDIDAARVQILLPQSLYPITNRSVLTAQTGFLMYGNISLPAGAALDYQAYAGVLSAPLPGAQDANANRVYAFDSKYVVGGDVFLHPPIEGLRIGASVLRASLDQYFNLAASTRAVLIAVGLAPPSFDGNLIFSLRPANLWVTSAEYTRGDWLVAAEYSHWFARTPVTPAVLPTTTTDSERFYAMATYHIFDWLAAGAYYAVLNADVRDRSGTDKMKFAQPFYAWKRDAAASLRFDVNDHWLWKLEAHFIDGAADLDMTLNPTPRRYWGMFLARTTVTF
jgi:hypothetical protein